MRTGKRLVWWALLLTMLLMLAQPLTALAEDYTYTVRFYAGGQGTFSGRDVIVYDGLHYGDRVSFSQRDVTLNNGSKYYVKGIRESGKDNNTVSVSSFVVTRDQDYVVAYGMLGNSVQYTIRYLDENGNELAPSESYYGNVGDKPVIAYLLIDGYRPQYYNLTSTLKADPAQNVFTFRYTAIPVPATATPAPTDTPAPTATPAPTGTPEASGEPTPTPEASGEPTPVPEATEPPYEEPEPQNEPEPQPTELPRIEINDPQELFDLDEALVPFAGYYNDDGEWVYYSDEMPQPEPEPESGNKRGLLIAVIVFVVLLLCLLLWLLIFLRRRKNKGEEKLAENAVEAASGDTAGDDALIAAEDPEEDKVEEEANE